MAVRASLWREERLAHWDLLLSAGTFCLADVETLVARSAREETGADRAACVLLLAAARLAHRGQVRGRRNLRAALRYWFSHTGTRDRPDELALDQLKVGGLLDFIGLYLTWPEALATVGVPMTGAINYMALKRAEQQLRKQCAAEWTRLFGSTAPSTLMEGGESFNE